MFSTSKVRLDNTADTTLTTWATSQINNAKLYIPIFTISWHKLRSEIATQPKNNNLDY